MTYNFDTQSRGAAFFASMNTTPDEMSQSPENITHTSVPDIPSHNDTEGDSGIADHNAQAALQSFNPSFFDPLASQRHLARRLTRKANLNEKLAQELEEYLMMTDAEQRLAQFAVSLQIRASLEERKKVQDDSYKIPDELKTTIKSYSRAALLSPTLTSYRGNLPEHVLAAMQDLNVHGIPDSTEVTQVRKVLKEIGTVLTNFRSHMKEKLKASLPEGSPTRNIADLTHAIVSNAPIQVTLQHYIRFAFLRWAVADTADSTEDEDFWVTVDDTVRDIRTVCKTEVAIARSFMQKYEEDKSKYGDPAETAHTVAEPKDIAVWQTTVGKHAANVQGVKSKKRRAE